MKRILREQYLNKLIALKDKEIIKVVTGVRRCGKSTLLQLYQDWLLSHGVSPEQIITVNFEDFDFLSLRDAKNLYDYVKPRLSSSGTTYIFFDEIQHVKDFPDVVNSLFIKPNVDIYITGSNAYMLSSEIATLLSGRYVEIAMLPLSFKEYVQATGNTKNLSRKYAEYVEFGSFPYALELRSQPKEWMDYVNGIYNTIVLKDIALRKNISDYMMLESITRFAFDNIGNLLSTKKIADTMTSYGRKVDVKTVEKYMSSLIETLILYSDDRFNIKGKQYLKTLEKYYVVDIGLRRAILGSAAFDVGHILENVVYLELLRRGQKVYVGKIDNAEVDFVTMSETGQCYYQVAATVRDNDTLQRELAPLRQISDSYQKILLTLDDDPVADYEGIKRVNALDWLMGD